MELDLLRIDLDMPTKKKAISFLKERLAYFNDVDFLHIENIKRIELVQKKTFGVKIFLKINLKSAKEIVMFQSLLGSDYRKECLTLINHYKFNMQYSNRLFDCKRYKNGQIKTSVKHDVTTEIKDYIKNIERKKNFC